MRKTPPLVACTFAGMLAVAWSMASTRSAGAQAPACDLSGHHAVAGLAAMNGPDGLAVTWNGETDRELRLLLTIDRGAPTIRSLSIRRKGGPWATLAANVTPEFRLVSGFRRMSNQQLQPLRDLGVAISPEIIAEKNGTRSGTRRWT